MKEDFCRLEWKIIEATLIKKYPQDSDWKIYINFLDNTSTYHQISFHPWIEYTMFWGNNISLEGIANESKSTVYTINKFTNEIIFYGTFDEKWFFSDKSYKLSLCPEWSSSMKALPQKYSPWENIFIVSIWIVLLLLFYIIFRKKIMSIRNKR